MKVRRSISEPVRNGLSWEARWKGEDQGLIACWERGRERAVEDPALAAKAAAGELPVLPWKGGHERPTKVGWKYGALNYLAMWQGLRGEDLNIEPAEELTATCARTGMRTIFTGDIRKYAEE